MRGAGPPRTPQARELGGPAAPRHRHSFLLLEGPLGQLAPPARLQVARRELRDDLARRGRGSSALGRLAQRSFQEGVVASCG